MSSVSLLRKPESIELTVFGISVLLLIFSLLLFYMSTEKSELEFPDLIYFWSAVLVICLLGETFFEKSAYRITFMMGHFFALLGLLLFLDNRFLVIEILILCTLIIQISLKTLLRHAVILNTAVLAAVTLIGVTAAGTLMDRFVVLIFGGLVIYSGVIIIYYREQLVKKTEALGFQSRSLANLAAATHSFVEHLEDVEAESAERERLRITRELHDSIGYSMTNIAMMMNASPYLIEENPQKLVEFCRKTKELSSTTLRETREILYKLRAIGKQTVQSPPMFFSKLCLDFSQATDVRTECHVGNLPGVVSERVFNILFRAAQVAFINALRHGNTGHIKLYFWVSDSELSMTVRNSVQEGVQEVVVLSEGIGLTGIRERVEVVGGDVAYGPVSDGFELVVTIPREELDLEAD